MKALELFLTGTKLARKQHYGNLTLFPLLLPGAFDPYYLILDEAIESGNIRVTEVDEGGHVPELLLINNGTMPVLIVEGEELVGAKQNRIVNASFLVPARGEFKLPVSCVEQGRWSYDSPEFSSEKRMAHASLRRSHRPAVAMSLRLTSNYEGDQRGVWDEVEEKSARMRVDSPTSAAAEIHKSYKADLDEIAEHFKLVDCQVGALSAIDSTVVGLEAFGCSDTFEKFFKKLVQSYALDALETMEDSHKPQPSTPARARAFVESVQNSQKTRYPSPGIGETLVLESRIMTGGALTGEDHVLHLTALRKRERGGRRGGGNRSGRFQSFSQRRRTRRGRVH